MENGDNEQADSNKHHAQRTQYVLPTRMFCVDYGERTGKRARKQYKILLPHNSVELEQSNRWITIVLFQRVHYSKTNILSYGSSLLSRFESIATAFFFVRTKSLISWSNAITTVKIIIRFQFHSHIHHH